MKLVLRLLSITVFSILAVILFEAGLMVFDSPPYPERWPSGIYDSDPDTGFVLRAGSEDTESSYEFKTVLRVNQIGLRDKEGLSFETRPDLFIIGDSFAQGTGVDLKNTFAKRVESILSINVVNLGVSSYGTRAELIRYGRYLMRFMKKPRLAVLAFYVGNDYYDNERSKDGPIQTVSSGYIVERGKHVKLDGDIVYLIDDKTDKVVDKKRNNAFHPPISVENETIKNLKTFNIISNFLYSNGALRKYLVENGLSTEMSCGLPIAIAGLFEPGYDFKSGSQWKETEGLIAEFIEMSKDNGVTPLVMIIPSKYQVAPDLLKPYGDRGCFDPEQMNIRASVDVLADYLRVHGVDYIDLLSEFSRLDRRRRKMLYYKVDSHFTKYGNKNVAEILARKIKALLPN